jgi:hypothetical protein
MVLNVRESTRRLGKYCTIGSLKIFSLHQYYCGDKNKKKKIVGHIADIRQMENAYITLFEQY